MFISDVICPSKPTSAVTFANTDKPFNNSKSPPVEYIAAAIVAVILAIAGLIVMVIVIMAFRRKQTSVKDKDLRENVSYSQTPNYQLSPHTGQVESPTTQVDSDAEKANEVEYTSAGDYRNIIYVHVGDA